MDVDYGCGQNFVNGVQDWHNCALKKKSIALKKCSDGETNGLPQPSVWGKERNQEKTTRPDFFQQRVFRQFIAMGIFFTYTGSFGDFQSY